MPGWGAGLHLRRTRPQKRVLAARRGRELEQEAAVGAD